MILYHSLEVEEKGTGQAREKEALYEKLGDLCCKVKAYAPAIKFYGEQVSWQTVPLYGNVLYGWRVKAIINWPELENKRIVSVLQ